MDSRAIVGAMNESVRKDMHAFTFGPSGSDEVRIARSTARHAGIRSLVSDVTPRLIMDNAEKEVWLTEGRAYMGVSFIPPVYGAIRDIVDVELNGFGLGLILGAGHSSRKAANCTNENDLKKRLLSRRLFSDNDLQDLVRPDYSPGWQRFAVESFDKEWAAVSGDSLGNKSDNFTLRTHVSYIPIGEMLSRVFVEASFPTMDNEFIDIMLKIPFEYRANHRIHRTFMRNLCPDLCKIPHLKTMLPISAPLCLWQLGNAYLFGKQKIKQAIWQYSRGHLSVPDRRTYVSFDEWLRTDQEWHSFFTQLLLNKDAASNRYFNQEYIGHLFSEHQKGRANNGRRILYLATFELLLRQFFV
jgi:asparagine synthetase B (glutamine-hydrolysing)